MRLAVSRVASVPDAVRARSRTLAASTGSLGRLRSRLGTDPAVWLTGIVVCIISWPVVTLEPDAGLDPSWAIALHQAAHQGLDFGPEMVFTYGPLGFLRQPLLVWPWTARLAFGYTLAVHLVLCLTLVWALRRNTKYVLIAGLLALVLAATITPGREPALVIGFIWTAYLFGDKLTETRAMLAAGGIGVLAGIELLAKLSTGATVFLLGVTALALTPHPRRRPAIAFAGGVALAAGVGWLATGQPIGNAWNWATGALGVASGYSEAMTYEEPGRPWEIWAAAMLVGLGGVAAWTLGPHRGRIGLLALWAVFSFFVFKAGFVRHDGGHISIFFPAMAGALCAFVVPRRHRAAGILAGLLALTAMFAAMRMNPADTMHPFARAKVLWNQVSILSDGSTTNERIAAARERVAGIYGLDPKTYSMIRDHTVHVDPVDAGLAWAVRLKWDPVPIFQNYSAYTEDLDRRNAEALADPDGPERVLRDVQAFNLDQRHPAFDPPATLRSMLCHYKATLTGERWQVLERIPNRCGAMEEISEVEARLGAPIEVPAPPDARSAVVAEIDGMQVGGLEKLRTFFYRAKYRGIGFDGTREYRLIPGTSGDGLVLRVPRRTDLPSPFTYDQVSTSISFTETGGSADDEVTVRFLSMPIR